MKNRSSRITVLLVTMILLVFVARFVPPAKAQGQDLLTRIANIENTIWGGALIGGGVEALTPTVYSGSTDAISKNSRLSVLTIATGADAATLATPVAGSILAGGDDGKVIRVISASTEGHTITTAANKIAGGGSTALGDTLTFANKQGASCTLVAYGGMWYVLNLTNVTLSEV